MIFKCWYDNNVPKKLMSKKKFVCVSPRSARAKVAFHYKMYGLHSCEVVRIERNEMYLTSINQRHSFWLSKGGNSDWEIVS